MVYLFPHPLGFTFIYLLNYSSHSQTYIFYLIRALLQLLNNILIYIIIFSLYE
jgi:hypothetical protein